MRHLLEDPGVHYVEAAGGVLSMPWLLVALPALGAAILLLGGRRTDRWGPYLACAMTGASFLVGLASFFALRAREVEERAVVDRLWSYIPVEGFQVDLGFLYDPLSATFVLLITGVGFLIHVYSLGYMAHDPGKRRFFAYLNLFVAAMLVLVLGDSFLALYLGWEGVGLASYLLIQFWSYKPSAATAAKKAFIVNRVGDMGLALAIFVMFATLGTTTYEGVFTHAEALTAGARPRSPRRRRSSSTASATSGSCSGWRRSGRRSARSTCARSSSCCLRGWRAVSSHRG